MRLAYLVTTAVLVTAACSSGADPGVKDVSLHCAPSGSEPSTNFGHRVHNVWDGSNGTFPSACHDGLLTSYSCERARVEVGTSRLGPIYDDVQTGNVIPAADVPCESVGGQCKDGACFYQPVKPAVDCDKGPPPCDLAPLHPEEPAAPDARCCVSGSAYHCATTGGNFTCNVTANASGCERQTDRDDLCYGP